MLAPTKNVVDVAKELHNRVRLESGVALSTKPVLLPNYPEELRAIPNCFLRSALFGATCCRERRYLDKEEIAAVDGIKIFYTGKRLDQGHLDVWESIVHGVRMQALGSKCRLKSYQLLKMMGKSDSGKNRKTLEKHITGLAAGSLTVERGRYSYIGSLVQSAARDEDTGEWIIRIDEKIGQFFSKDQFTLVQWSIRLALGRHQLAQWLHGFYATHAKPFPLKIETLHKLCGSEAAVMSDFAKTLRKALDAVCTVSAQYGEKPSYNIRGGLVHFHKKALGSQKRHLEREAAKVRRPRT